MKNTLLNELVSEGIKNHLNGDIQFEGDTLLNTVICAVVEGDYFKDWDDSFNSLPENEMDQGPFTTKFTNELEVMIQNTIQ